jgi:Domain of unknown function (DUF6968)
MADERTLNMKNRFEVIAERILFVDGDVRTNVYVRLGKPSPGVQGDVCCAFEIIGLPDIDEDVWYSSGADDFSAILSAIGLIATRIHTSSAAKAGILKWLEDDRTASAEPQPPPWNNMSFEDAYDYLQSQSGLGFPITHQTDMSGQGPAKL